jgi:hypothetical protein
MRRGHLLDRLALQTAIIQHLEWCVLFNAHLSLDERPDQQLSKLPSAEESGLGQWLIQVRQETGSEGARWDELAKEHAQFHRLAQKALGYSRQGRMDLASTLLNTDFERSRTRVLELLRQMQKK